MNDAQLLAALRALRDRIEVVATADRFDLGTWDRTAPALAVLDEAGENEASRAVAGKEGSAQGNLSSEQAPTATAPEPPAPIEGAGSVEQGARLRRALVQAAMPLEVLNADNFMGAKWMTDELRALIADSVLLIREVIAEKPIAPAPIPDEAVEVVAKAMWADLWEKLSPDARREALSHERAAITAYEAWKAGQR